MLRLLSDAEVISQFGSPDRFITEDGHASAGWEGQTLDKFRLPAPLPLSWDKQRLVTHARCHRALRPELEGVLKSIHTLGLWSTIGDFGGCYAFRRIRRGRGLSRHSWGIAIDLDVGDNPQGAAGEVHPLVIQAFYDVGWLWGGWFQPPTLPDSMHFEKAARL